MTRRVDLSIGRINQKRRTRERILQAAAELIREGKNISVSDAADIAGISRMTAYRYYPTVDALIANAALWAVAAREQEEFEQGFPNDISLGEKIDALIVQSDQITNAHRNEFRHMLRMSLEGEDNSKLRLRHRYFTLQKALADKSTGLSQTKIDKLRFGLSLAMGIEAQVVLRDICELDDAQALRVKRWVAQALLAAALNESSKKKSKSGKRTGD